MEALKWWFPKIIYSLSAEKNVILVPMIKTNFNTECSLVGQTNKIKYLGSLLDQ